MPDLQLYVAPWGRDEWQGTHQAPFATLNRARRAVRAATPTMAGDIVVNLRAGTYTLTEPFQLLASEGDGGRDGHRVVYQAYGYGTAAPERVVLSGGREITGWEPHDPATGVWRAGVGDLDTRQLSVDGRRAERARQPGLPGTLTRTETGYVTDSTAPKAWADPASVEFVYQGIYPWSEARCQVAAITGDERSTTITMAQPAFGWAGRLYAFTFDPGEAAEWAAEWDGDLPGWGGLDRPTWVENSVSFLTEPGAFALDRSSPGRHVLYYLPRPGEDPRRVTVVAPVLERLIGAAGTATDPLRDLTLRGLTLAHATWLRPSAPEGFLHFHGGSYYDGGPLRTVVFAGGQGSVTVPADQVATVPGNVVLEHTAGTIVEGNHFTALGADALTLTGASTGNVVRGNRFDDVAGAGVTLDGGEGSRGNRIERNRVHRIGRDYRGSPGIQVGPADGTVVAHNHVGDVPHCGIVVNGGDGARGGRVTGNLVEHTMTALADGGGIYLSGRQGASFASGAVVSGNVIRDLVTSYNFGLYTDYGAAWVTVQGNAVWGGDTPVILRVDPPLDQVVFVGNLWDADPDGHDDPPAGVVVAGNRRLPRDGFERALAADPAGADILASAGPGPDTGPVAEPTGLVVAAPTPAAPAPPPPAGPDAGLPPPP